LPLNRGSGVLVSTVGKGANEEVDGVRKEKERLTTDHQPLIFYFIFLFLPWSVRQIVDVGSLLEGRTLLSQNSFIFPQAFIINHQLIENECLAVRKKKKISKINWIPWPWRRLSW
jgi:hypothetical protein